MHNKKNKKKDDKGKDGKKPFWLRFKKGKKPMGNKSKGNK